jgi:hypothetical protein
VFLLPYLNIYLSQRGLSPAQIGLLAALRPWVSAPCGMAASAAADATRRHTQLLVGAVTLLTLSRAGLPLVEGVVMMAGLLVASEVMAATVAMVGDAVVLSNCKDVSAGAVVGVLGAGGGGYCGRGVVGHSTAPPSHRYSHVVQKTCVCKPVHTSTDAVVRQGGGGMTTSSPLSGWRSDRVSWRLCACTCTACTALLYCGQPET